MDERSSSLFDRLFAITIAFLVPGLVALFAVAAVSPTVQRWFSGASNGPTLAGFFFVVLGALALGFVITAIRYCIFEVVRVPFFNRCLVGRAQEFDESKRKDFAAEYLDLRLQHYYHYLAYANLSVAIPIAVAIWKAGNTVPASATTAATGPSWSLFVTILVLATLASVALAAAGCDAVCRYDDKRTRLLGPRHSAA